MKSLTTLLGQECWELLAMVCKPMQQLPTMLEPARKKMQQVVQTDAAYNIQQCWELLVNNVAFVCTGFKPRSSVRILIYRTWAITRESFH